LTVQKRQESKKPQQAAAIVLSQAQKSGARVPLKKKS